MRNIKVNADLYVGNDKLATTSEVNNIVNSSASQVIDTTGDGSKFLSDDGTYKNAGTDTEQVKTEIGETLSDYGIQQSGNDGFYIVHKDGNDIMLVDVDESDLVISYKEFLRNVTEESIELALFCDVE